VPLWDFFCSKCGFTLTDYMVWEKEDEWMPCPKCGENMIKKIPHVNVKIKGGTPKFYPNKKKEKKYDQG